MSGDPGRSAGEARARIRSALGELVKADEAEFGLLLEDSGIVSAAAGSPGKTDPVAFGSLASAYVAAVSDLAPALGGGRFSQLLQTGPRSRIRLLPMPAGRAAVLLHRSRGATEGGLDEEGPDAAPLEAAIRALAKVETRAGDRRVGREWIRAAEHEIDRIFREKS
ncbi:MAG: hypothetical protein EA352_10365 [Gemmatimonadales bacterium]|nr:MAG: hypothetical protein EA352_10365 [Gemmatimonadales bacterium]